MSFFHICADTCVVPLRYEKGRGNSQAGFAPRTVSGPDSLSEPEKHESCPLAEWGLLVLQRLTPRPREERAMIMPSLARTCSKGKLCCRVSLTRNGGIHTNDVAYGPRLRRCCCVLDYWEDSTKLTYMTSLTGKIKSGNWTARAHCGIVLSALAQPSHSR